MFDAVEVIAKCPKGCDKQLIKCSPSLYICPQCKTAYVFAQGRGGSKERKGFFRKTSAENVAKCKEILKSGNWKPLIILNKNEQAKESMELTEKTLVKYFLIDYEVSRLIKVFESKGQLEKYFDDYPRQFNSCRIFKAIEMPFEIVRKLEIKG